jgi:hypothetical protein
MTLAERFNFFGGEEMSPGIAVAVVPEDYYRKPKGVQFRKSFPKRQDAIEYAETNGCRMVIACESGSRYDVLFDPGSIPGLAISFDLVVDRGEMVAVPRVRPSRRKLPELPTTSASQRSQPSLKLALSSVYGWLSA